MADDWKEQMQERFDKLETKFDSLGEKFDHLDQKVDHLDQKVDHLDRKVDDLDKKVDALNHEVTGPGGKVSLLDAKVTALDGKVTTAEERLSNNFKIAVEEMKDSVKKLGEGYQAGLDTILREMKDMNSQWESKWGIHDRALKNHARRLNKLEGGSLNK